MPGSPATLPAPDLPPGRRLALVVSTTTYADPALRQLRAPAADATELREVLAAEDVGGFSVTTVADATAQDVRLAVEDFLADRKPEDLLLVYVSCHGLVDLRRRLYFATRDTLKHRLGSTAVEAQWLIDGLDECRARQQVVILDCCFSGAFASGAKGEGDLGLGERFGGHGRGRVVLTASRATEYSFEGESLDDRTAPTSLFTSALVSGLRSGAADLDGDGYISVDDAYAYAYDALRANDARQTPQRWLYGAEGEIVLARSRAGVTLAPAEVPETLRSALDNPHPAVRLGAVAAIGEWLSDDDPTHVLAARQTLGRVAEGDTPRVAGAARDLLASSAGDPAASPPPALPDAPSAARHWALEAVGPAGSRRRLLALAAAALLTAAAVAALALLDRGGPSAERPQTAAGAGEAMTAPWRLAIHDEIEVADDGCNVTLTNTTTGNELAPFVEVYDQKSFQIHETGTFTWTVNDPGCLVFTQPGAGAETLPFSWGCCAGDTDACDAPAEFMVDVTNFRGSSDCELALHDARTGTIRARQDVRPRDLPVLVTPGEAGTFYLADLTCDVRVYES